MTKERPRKAPVLTHYDVKKPLLLTCDGLGAVLAHQTEDNEQPFAFHSSTMAPAENNYSQVEKEALAIMCGVRKFHKYVWDRHFKIYTDHEPLLGLLGEMKPLPQHSSARLQRWALLMQGYDYELI